VDIIVVKDFRVEARVGVYAWEQLGPQTIQLDLEIGLPASAAAPELGMRDTIDYGAVVERVRQSLAEKRFDLLEALAQHVATLLLEEFKAPWTRVAATKLALIRSVKSVGVVLERGVRPQEQ
jgi:dihydroneopterin aldolase